MNTLSATIDHACPHQPKNGLQKLASALKGLLASFATGTAAWHEYQQLDGLSDEQLAQHGLGRDALPRHIFGRFFD